MDYTKIRESIKNLPPMERKLLFIDLLYDGSISFTELTEAYISVLERNRKEQGARVNKLSMRLSATWDYVPEKKKFTKAAAAFALLPYYEGAGVEKTYKAYLHENPYDEDENGFPKTELKDTGNAPRIWKSKENE